MLKTVRFGPFQLDLRTGELRKFGTKIKLAAKSFEVLAALLEQPGQVITREALRARLWPADVFVDFDNGLNSAVNRLREALGDSADKPRFIETLPRRGYRFVAPVSCESAAPQPTAPQPSIAVLPFTDMAREKDQEYFCDGLAEELTNALTRLRGLRVIARTSAFAFKGKAVDVREIGRQLGVGAVLEGGVQRSGDRLRITVQLVNAADGGHLWSDRFDRAAGDVFAIQDEIAQAVVGALQLKLLGDDEARLLRRHTGDTEAYDLYLKGRYICARRTPEAMMRAARCFEQAAERDPGYASAYAALSECYCVSGFLSYLAPQDSFPKAKAAARQALDLDPTLAEGHAVLGWTNWAYDWHWLEAETRFRRAEELSPSYALARMWHSELLVAMARFDEAVAEAERARQLDPLSLTAQAWAGAVLYEARQYEGAVARLLKTLEMDPDFALANFHLGRVCCFMGRHAEALTPLEKAAPGFPMALGGLGGAWAKLGRRDKAAEVLQELERISAERYVGPMAFVTVHLGLDDLEAALQWLEKSFDAHEGIVPLANVDPAFDGLRSEPRFTTLLKRLKLPPAALPR